MASTRAILIIGGSGFIGSHLALGLRDRYKVYATYHSKPIRIPGVTCLPYDVADRNWGKRMVYAARPDVVVYAAGSNNMEYAEANPRDAERMHTGGAATASSVSDILQPRFIYLSNCYTFDGNRGNYREGDTVLPVTALGKAKVGGENFIRGRSLNYIVVRTSPIFGRGNGLNLTFIDKIRMRLDRGERVEMLANELHSFTLIDGFVEFMRCLIENGPKNKVIHYAGLTKMTYYDFAREFARRFGYDESLIIRRQASISENAVAGTSDTASVFDYSLNSTLTVETLKVKPLLLEEAFDLFEKKLIP